VIRIGKRKNSSVKGETRRGKPGWLNQPSYGAARGQNEHNNEDQKGGSVRNSERGQSAKGTTIMERTYSSRTPLGNEMLRRENYRGRRKETSKKRNPAH